jgi:hypothetical protein
VIALAAVAAFALGVVVGGVATVYVIVTGG